MPIKPFNSNTSRNVSITRCSTARSLGSHSGKPDIDEPCTMSTIIGYVAEKSWLTVILIRNTVTVHLL
ncbi:Uncharacterised protein [Chlamydia trachomatis]|nr:Uncharacterised protein [Chlamydia trachomatis]